MSTNDREFQEGLKKMRRDIDIVQAAIAKQAWALEIVSARISEWEKQEKQEQAKQAETRRSRNRNRKRPAARKDVPRKRPHAARTSNSSELVEPVNNVIIEHDRNGLMLVHVENYPLAAPLQNRQRLRQLLLAMGGKVSRVNVPTNGIIPFKTKTELIEVIEKLGGQRISAGNLQNLVRQLRVLFVKAQINPNLIQTGGGGYRLRLFLEGRIFENVS